MVHKDFFRDTKVRYLGYANEIGEALRPIIDKKYVRYSYGIASGYVLADVIDKAVAKMYTGRPTKVLWATGDAIIWQGLASIVLPGMVINRIVHFSGKAVEKRAPQFSILSKIPKNRRVFIPVCIGFASIPVIIHPIDLFVHAIMDLTYRKMHDATAE